MSESFLEPSARQSPAEMTTPPSPSPQRGLYRVSVDPVTLRWAQERSGKDVETLERRFPKYREWEAGTVKPTYRQLRHFARATYTPFGALFSGGPLKDELDITDFRTVGGTQPRKPSPHLLDTVYLCQSRQAWYHEYALAMELDPVEFVGSASLDDDPAEVAQKMSSTLAFHVDDRSDVTNWTLAVRHFADRADAKGVLVMISGVVGNNTWRPLDVEEFRGFALSDALAPLVFVNGADAKAAQMFTLAHELAHIWLGNTGLSNTTLTSTSGRRTEEWCNQVAAELLIPLDVLREEYHEGDELQPTLRRLTAHFKVSSLVVLRRLHDAGYLSPNTFRQAYDRERRRVAVMRTRSGGDFFRTHSARVGKRFTYDLIADTLRGRTLYTEASYLLAIKKQATFDKIKINLGLR